MPTRAGFQYTVLSNNEGHEFDRISDLTHYLMFIGALYNHKLVIAGIIIFVCPVFYYPLFAATQYCGYTKDQSFAGLSYGNVEQSQLATGSNAQVAITTNEFASNLIINETQQHVKAVGFGFQYTIMDFESVTPMTNGHLYTVDFPFSGRITDSETEIFYNLTPAISVSSNALKNPELIDGEGLQLNTGLVYKKELHRKHAWLIGFISDHRFGDYLLYPVVGVCWQPAHDWRLQLALPDFSISKTFSSGINLVLYAAPAGNQWHVFSKDRTRDSDLTYNAIAFGITAQWRINSAARLGIDFEKQTRREFSIVLDDNSLIEPTINRGIEFTLKAEVLF